MRQTAIVTITAFALCAAPGLAQEAAAPSSRDVCLTNACSDPLAATERTPEQKREVAMGRASSQMSFMQAGYFTKGGTALPEGSRVDIKTSLRTDSGEVFDFTLSPGMAETGFAHNDPSRTPYMIGAQINASQLPLVVEAAVRLNGEDIPVPRQALAPGQAVTVQLPGGRQLSMTATIRHETDRERAMSQTMRARMSEVAKSRPAPSAN